MKCILKYVGLMITALLVSIVIYPALHELGHAVIALALGVKIIDFNLLPLPYVVCDFTEFSNIKFIATGLGGMALPFGISTVIQPKNFWAWYGVLMIRMICLLSFIISFISIILYMFNIVMEQEDVIKVLSIWENGKILLLCILFFAMIVIFFTIVKEKPVKRIFSYFSNPKEASVV